MYAPLFVLLCFAGCCSHKNRVFPEQTKFLEFLRRSCEGLKLSFILSTWSNFYCFVCFYTIFKIIWILCLFNCSLSDSSLSGSYVFLCGFVWLHLVLSVRVEKHWLFSFYKPELPQSWVRLFSDRNESPEEQSSADARVRLKTSFRVKSLCIHIRLFRYSVETAVHTGSLRLLPHLAPFSVECVYFVC